MLAHGITEAQAFIEGNKRMALAGMIEFLLINGYDLDVEEDEPASWILRLAPDPDATERRATVEEIAECIRESLIPLFH